MPTPPPWAPSSPARFGLTLEWLEPSDLQAMVDLFRRGTDPGELSRSIYAAPGGAQFLVSLAMDPERREHEQFWGLRNRAGRLLGAAHTRDLPAGASHLNQITVEPALRGWGLGAWMLARWQTLGWTRGASRLTLDVADSNPGARQLYARHGFTVARCTYEYRYRGSLPAARTAGWSQQQWPEAQASFRRYGFGRFLVERQGECFPVDLNGDFRVPDPDPELLGFLTWLDPARGVLLRTEHPAPAGPWRATGAILRMYKDLAEVEPLAREAARSGPAG